MDKQMQDYCWTLSLGHQFSEKLAPFGMPRFKQAISFLGLSLRYLKYHRDCKKNNIEPHMDYFAPTQLHQVYGVPMGGIGTGTIGRSYTGDFLRYQLIPGIYEHKTVDSNLFTVCIRKKSRTCYQQVLSTRRSKQKGLRSWNMAYSGDQAKYYALYPESWTVYNLPGQNVTLTCHQLSPIIPENYKDSSLPVSLFNWTIENKNSEEIEFSLMFTWQAGSASNKFELTDVSSKSFTNFSNLNTCISGVTISQKLRNMPLDYCIAAKNSENCKVTYNCQFYADNEVSGNQLWLDLLDDGNLNNNEFNPDNAPKKSKLNIAVCVQVKLKPSSKEKIDFSLVWNMPNVSFFENNKVYKKFYTRYFPETNENASQDIATYALSMQNDWVKDIRKWQKPIHENKALPSWYKIVLFNELYFISDGGTVWFDMKDDPTCTHETIREFGRFAYLEGQEYRMYNTYDVHFYASFALLILWPKLQLSLQYEFADTIPKESENSIKFLIDGKFDKQKAKNCVPHDIGDPYREPWLKLNAYNSHNSKNWKDMNLKFVLTVFRDYHHLKDLDYLKYMWPYVKMLMMTVKAHDLDGDGLIDGEGLPDQTYDAWAVTGASAYCGGLHLATLKCVCQIAEILGDKEAFEEYSNILRQAKNSYNAKLWNGKYYKYDCSKSDYNDSIMTDMCCGHWYLRCSGFKHEVFEEEKIKSCLETIFEYNVMKYGNGQLGSVNGMRPDGSVDITSMQSEEVWVGVTDALASLLIFEGMNDKAWKTLEGMYDTLFNRLGVAFQTPEALMKPNIFRSLGYMRPLCIWSVQYALDKLAAEI